MEFVRIEKGHAKTKVLLSCLLLLVAPTIRMLLSSSSSSSRKTFLFHWRTTIFFFYLNIFLLKRLTFSLSHQLVFFFLFSVFFALSHSGPFSFLPFFFISFSISLYYLTFPKKYIYIRCLFHLNYLPKLCCQILVWKTTSGAVTVQTKRPSELNDSSNCVFRARTHNISYFWMNGVPTICVYSHMTFWHSAFE